MSSPYIKGGCDIHFPISRGWDQEGSNGANLSFPEEFGLTSKGDLGDWIVGIINAGYEIYTVHIGTED